MNIPEEIERYRDRLWRREEVLKVSDAPSVEAFVEDVGFALTLTDVRIPIPSLYIAVCGRRDVHTPRTVQKDPEASAAWLLKDEVMRRGNVYYSKLAKGRATFVSRSLVPSYNAVHGIPKSEEDDRLSPDALKVLRVLREEWESSTADLKEETGIKERKNLSKAIEELQRCMKVVPYEVLYEPKFTYLWTLAEERFPTEMAREVGREDALYDLARTFLKTCGLTLRAELSKATGVGRAEAGAANQRLVDEGFAVRLGPGIYRLKNLNP